jgi:plasmid stabilization system protein ParE
VRIARPRHFVAFRVTPTAIEVLRILHDAMDLPVHLGDED